MSVVVVNGVPGTGKTLNLTREAIRQFRQENSLLQRIQRRKRGEEEWINHIYSNYPITLNKRHNIVCKPCSIFDLTTKNKFPEGSSIFIMELQLSYDSMEYSTFPDIIATFLQAHRHGGIRDIFFDSQSMSRIPKRARIIACERWQVLWTFLFPIIPLGLTKYKVRYDTEEEQVQDSESKYEYKFFNKNVVCNAYDNKCLRALWRDANLFDPPPYNKLNMEYSDIIKIYFRTKEQKQELSRINLEDLIGEKEVSS